MQTRDFERRKYDCFISYGSEDVVIAEQVNSFLESSGLHCFLDTKRLAAATEVDEGLAIAMNDSKACLALLSPNSVKKNYVQEELRFAKSEVVNTSGFRLITAILDEGFNPADSIKGLGVRSWLPLHDGISNLENARNLLLSLRRAESTPHQGQPHVYVSCSWRDNESNPRDPLLALLKKNGAFLVGDSLDQKSFKEDGPNRIKRIMSSCSGFVGIYPDRRDSGRSQEDVYKYFLAELQIAKELGLVLRTYCTNLDSLPLILRNSTVVDQQDIANDKLIAEGIDSFLEEVGPAQPHSFLATDFKQSIRRNEAAKDIIESLLGMKCHLGKEVIGNDLRQQIRRLIRDANIVLADLACSFDAHKDGLQININTCIEAGMAMAYDKPLFLLALDPTVRAADASKTRSIPFFFRDHSIEWYRDDPEFLANVYRISFNRRRRVINDEIE